MKDKNRIWTDCAECAYKHLTAAYALATSYVLKQGNPDSGAEWMTFVARAVIATREAASGYYGNKDLAIGCLAAAEHLAPTMTGLLIRKARLVYEKEGDSSLIGNLPADDASYVNAHLTEAVRELPGLLGGDVRLRDFNYAFFNWDKDPEAADRLPGLIQFVRDNYELEKRNEDKKTDIVEPAGGGTGRADRPDAPLPPGQ